MAIDGILNVDKPKGKTSFSIIAAIRKTSGERRVGHGGTLDPEAIGVLPVCLGKATRLVEFLMETRKTYRAEIELGVSTDTYDASGVIIRRCDTSALTEEKVEGAIEFISDMVEQVPPMYSAVKHRGVPLYHYARKGMEIPRKARKVQFYRVEVLDWLPPIMILEVECSKGTYIRSMANDIGENLGCGAYLKSLIRLSSGPFYISESLSITLIEDAFKEGYWKEIVQPIDMAVKHLPAITVDDVDKRAIVNGCPVTGIGVYSGDLCRAHSMDGQLIAILFYEKESGSWKPRKVLA